MAYQEYNGPKTRRKFAQLPPLRGIIGIPPEVEVRGELQRIALIGLFIGAVMIRFPDGRIFSIGWATRDAVYRFIMKEFMKIDLSWPNNY
jgi:hypothetical protein